MPKPHIVVIDPAVKKPELEVQGRLALRANLPVTYHLPALFGTGSLWSEGYSATRADKAAKSLSVHLPPAGIIILGSGSSVHDQLPWQQELGRWLMPQMLDGTPTLGLCFGHQLIAHMFGGTVGMAFADDHKAVGLREIHLAPSRLWGGRRSGSVVVSHKEAVLKLPQTFRSLGSSPTVAHEAMEHQTLPIWGFQSHPEACDSFLQDQGVSLTEDDLFFGHELVGCFLDCLSPRPR